MVDQLDDVILVAATAYAVAVSSPLSAARLRRVLARSGEALLALGAIYGIWAIHFFGFADFSYRW